MKTALVYPKIPNGEGFLPTKCWAFEKLDGTNMHFVWSRAQHDHLGDGWVRFGTRRDTYLIAEGGQGEFWREHHGLEGAFPAFWHGPKKGLEKKFSEWNAEDITVFTEYRGPNSFAGQHLPEDFKTHTIIDVQVNGKFIPPNHFTYLLMGLPIPKVVYTGKYSGQFVEDVRNGLFRVNEGVVCKGMHDGIVHMTKIKTLAYEEKLKSAFNNQWESYM